MVEQVGIVECLGSQPFKLRDGFEVVYVKTRDKIRLDRSLAGLRVSDRPAVRFGREMISTGDVRCAQSVLTRSGGSGGSRQLIGTGCANDCVSSAES
jgi:hypothetical protein